ncbi:MAG: hypothetical protein H7A50_16415, partial [Akkermansiaceae bacterium]|nr:hypothetical protein [Akkermansiaceae bacterium]
SQWIIQAASLYLVWIEGPQSTTALTAGVLPSEDLGPLSDQMRITSSLHTETEKEKKVFLATALNDLASWPTHLRLRTAALGGEENKPWIESQNSLVATLKETKDILNAMAASNTADDAHGEAELTQDQKTFLEQLMKEFGAAWDETTLPQKIDLILPILNPPSSPSPAINPNN